MELLPYPLTHIDRMAVRHFRSSLPRSLRSEFESALATILSSETEFAVDQTTQSHLIFASVALSSYRIWLREGRDKDDAKAKVRRAARSFLKRSTQLMMRIAYFFAKDPFEVVRKYSVEKPQEIYGPSFEFENAEIEGGFVSIVNVCGFRSFLARHGADELIDVFCEWDRIWIDALPNSIAFDRPTTLAQGGKACRFEFRRRRPCRAEP